MPDADIRAQMGITKFYYTPGISNYTVSTLAWAVFLLSFTELGMTHEFAKTEGTPLSSTVLKLLKVAYLNGSAVEQWTRSPYVSKEYARK